MPDLTRIQLRRGSTSDWTTDNPILAIGEVGVEITSTATKFKIGNGSENWADLPYYENTDVLEKYKSIDYGSLPYGDTEKVRQYISNNKESNFLDLATEVIKMLTGDDISEQPFAEIIGTVDFFLKQWIVSTASTMNLTKVAEMKKASGQVLNDSTDSEASVLMLN